MIRAIFIAQGAIAEVQMKLDRKRRWNAFSLLVILGLAWTLPAQTKIPALQGIRPGHV
jgi:hypothetical protein